MRAPQGLAIDGDHLTSRQHVHGLNPFQKAALKFSRIQRREDPPEGVMRRAKRAARQLQEPAKPFLFGLTKLGHLHPAIRAAHYGADGDQDNVQQLMLFGTLNPWVGQSRKTGRQRANRHVFQGKPRS